MKMPEQTLAVTCHLEPAQILYHLSKLLTRLCELARQGRLELRFTTVAENSPQSSAEAVLNAFITNHGTTQHVVFDMLDKSDRFDIALLDPCGLYFKRSFYLPDIWAFAMLRSIPVLDEASVF